MELPPTASTYTPQHYFNYPFTLVSLPKKTFISKPIQQPSAYEVYCPISCKKIKIGAARIKQKEGVQFNTTSSRLVSSVLNKHIRYLINGNPPNKRQKKQVEGQGWSFWVQVSEKGNFAIFNPYCNIPNDPLSLYTFSKIAKTEGGVALPLFLPRIDSKDYETINVRKNTYYFQQNSKGSYISTNTHFGDSVSGVLTFINPNDATQAISLSTQEALKVIPANKHYWLHQLLNLMIAEQQSQSSLPNLNLDQIYQSFGNALNLEEQLRAKLSNSQGIHLLDSKIGYHPRLYSEISRLSSFINYGVSKYNIHTLAELGFYNRSDILQDLRFFEVPQIPIPVAEDPSFKSQFELRSKLLPFSRLQRGLPNTNVNLQTFINALLHQQISTSKIIFKQSIDNYLVFVDEKGCLTVWSCRLFPIKLFQLQHGIDQEILSSNITVSQKQLEAVNLHHQKQDNSLASLFEEVPPPAAKEQKPAQIVPDPAMIEQMQQMGYNISLIKKALIVVKNQSVPSAIDAIEQLVAEEKKKKNQKKIAWSCSACTFFNKAENDTCEMCGQLFVVVDQAQKQRIRLQQQAQKQRELKKLQEQAKAKKEAEEAKIKAELQQAEKQRKKQERQLLLKRSSLIATKLYFRSQSPIDPFFIIQLFWNQDNQKSCFKVTRVGINRQHFARFYRIQDKTLTSNLKHFPYQLNFESFERIASESVDQREWGVRLIEPVSQAEWGVVSIQQKELSTKYTSIEIRGDYITLTSQMEKLHFLLQIKDSLEKSSFTLIDCEKIIQQPPKEVIAQKVEDVNSKYEIKQIEAGQLITLDSQISQIQVEVLQHLPGGVWKPQQPLSAKTEVSTAQEGEVVMNELIPLFIEHFDGSVFSAKHYSTTILEKGPNLYISNYPNINFTFRHLQGKSIFAESVVIVSSSKRLQRIFSVYQGLIFTADQPSWFHLALQHFKKFTKSDYQEWLTSKRARNEHREFWEPVAFFQFENQTEIQLDYKRTAKYVFLLPTNVKDGEKKKGEVYAIKLDFFGVKGRIQNDRDAESSEFKNQGSSGCSIELLKEGTALNEHTILSKVWGNVNSFSFYPKNRNFLYNAPLSTTTVFLYKLRSHSQPVTLKVESKYAQKVRVRLGRQINEQQVESAVISSYTELVKVQNDFTGPQLKKIVEKLQTRQLLQLLLQSDRLVSPCQTLVSKLEDSIDFKEKLYQGILELVPKLVDEQLPVTETGFKSFLTLYEKHIGAQPAITFSTNTEALRRIIKYISEKRNKNYNVLRLKYNIQELVLEPYLFSKDYYRMVHPNFVEEEIRSPASSEPNGNVNCLLFAEQFGPYFYRLLLDLQETKQVQAIRLFIPRITTPAFRSKLRLAIWSVNDDNEQLIYSRYFHQDTLVQLGVNGFKDSEIYRGERLNCLTIPEVGTETRFIKIEYSLLLGSTQPHIKYKDIQEKFILVPLVEGRSTGTIQPFTTIAQNIKRFPQEMKHFYNLEKLPPCRYSTEGPRSSFAVHQFPVLELATVKQEYRQIVEKIVANIMDETIVRQALKGLKVTHYEFNRKGIDFAYTLLIHLMSLSKRFPNELHVSVELMLQLFDTLVVFQAGPIMRRTFTFLQDNYKRLSLPQRAVFIDSLVTKYLESLDTLPSLRLTDKYSPLKVLEKLQQFQLPIANLFRRLDKTSQKSLKLLLLKLIGGYLPTNGFGSLELYCPDTGKYIQNLPLIDLMLSTFSACLWVLDNVVTLKEQVLIESLDLLLLLLKGEGDVTPAWAELHAQALKAFVESVSVEQIWRLVFLTLRLKSETLKERINKMFGVLTSNLTQKFKRSINQMLQQIIVREQGSLYVTINPALSDQLWMNHLQTTLQLVTMTRDSLFLDLQIALKLLELPLTPRLWSLALHIIPRSDEVLVAIIRNFPPEFYSSLGKQITHFCQPLAGIRSLQSSHINWLELVRQIRLEGKTLFQLLVQQLQRSSFGGREGLTMATTAQLKQLEIASQLAKLLTQKKPSKEHLTEPALRKLFLWYFLNKTKEKGASPATDKILSLSNTVRQLLSHLAEFEDTTRTALRILLDIRRQGEVVERNFLEKRIPVHCALTLNKRFCQCFEELLAQFMTTDQLCGYFAFQLKGLEFIMRTMDIETNHQPSGSQTCPNDEQLLLSEKIVALRASGEKAGEGQEAQQLKEEEFANNIKLMPTLNLAGLHSANVDWTIYKKGNKTKIVFLSMAEPGYYHEHPLYIQLAKTAQIRSIKVGFPAASYEFNDKLVATPSGVIVEGSLDGVSFEPIGEMDYLRDDAYIMNGVQVWVLNCQRLRGLRSVGDAVQGLGVHRARYLKIIVKRPIITFIQGQYSQLNGRNYSSLGCSLSFLSVSGDDAQKAPGWQGCRESSKRSVLRVLATLLSECNSRTMRRIANDDNFSGLVRTNFRKIREYMTKYAQVMPQVVHLVGSGNRDLGDWIVTQFLNEGGAETQARILNQIIVSTPDRAFSRLSRLLTSILDKLATASTEPEIEAGVIYTQEIHFIQAFCKTLEQSYELGISQGSLEVTMKHIGSIISIYDRRHSSPDIKSAVKLLVSLLYLKKPLVLSEPLVLPAMNLVWLNCSEQKTHFYHLMSALLVDRGASTWLTDNEYSKVAQLVEQTYLSCTHAQLKNLRLQLMLLSQISHHVPVYLRQLEVHVQLYNRVKVLSHQDPDITEAVLKLMRNVVLGAQQEEKRVATLLFQDVGLLVKRKDPFLQRLFVGLLGLEQEVMINLQGLELQSPAKKEITFNSKFLTNKHAKLLNTRINKKCKYSLLGEINGQIKVDHQELFLKAFSCNSFILIIRFQVNEQIHTCGVYSSTPGKRNQQGDYFWEQIILYDKNSFLFFLEDPEPYYITNEGQDLMLGNIFGGDEEQENAANFYDESQETFSFSFNTTEATVPKLQLNRYKQHLPNELTENTLDSDNSSYTFIGLQFWELKLPNTLNLNDSRISNLLSKSNHAKPPFSYYRHSPIYIFPANITIHKFINILGLKGNCYSRNTQLPEMQMLAELEKLSNDFVVDLNIQSQEEPEEQKEQVNQIGYIPVMRIFNHFSAMDGVGEVLRLGSESIKDWKKPDRKKNFQHYMDELKSFINLPSFFNLFIKNQQYVTLLFEVASGLPDDEVSTRNWEEQYVNNFRFIYKIVSDIFKFDRSPALRDMDRYSDFVDVILEKLSQITKEASRVLKEQEEEETIQTQGLPTTLAKVKSEDKKRKKKGTGYGSDNQSNSKWSASDWLETRKNISQETLRVISIIASFLDCEVPLKDVRLSEIIKQSCLLPLLESTLRSGSLLDISKQSELFKAYLQIVKLISSHPSTIDCVLDLDKKYKPEQSESIYSLLSKLNGTATIFSQCLKSGKDQQQNNQTAEGISIDIQRTFQTVDKAVKDMKKKGKGYSVKQINNMPIAEAYRLLLGNLRFGHVNLKQGNAYKHAHSSSISTSTPPTAKILRLSQELADLSTSLPCQHTNSIFVRCDQSRIDVINIMIMGSKDTPYSNGAFTFDVYCDDSYPNNPPKMLITTTGQGKIRFNPNLYSCGKVCLSLLGTWRGSASENWDPKVSTLLQLFISTQGITMSDDVYFNEPGFQGEQGTEQGDRKNEAYSNIVKLGNVRYAMNGQLKNPPKGFEQVVKRHFYIKQKQIIQECEKWIQQAEKREASYNGLVNDHNSSWCTELKQSKTKYKELLVKQVEELKELLSKLQPPNLNEKEEEHTFVSEKLQQKTEIKTVQAKLEEVDVEYDKEPHQIKESTENVLQDRWSRYIGAMGLEAVKKQAQSSVLLIGLKPLGLQIAKNLVLSGLKRLTIFDDESSHNTSEHFYMANLKSAHFKECVFKIKELNPYMLVQNAQTLPPLDKYSLVVSTVGLNQSKQIAENARKLGVKFIYAETKGVSGIYFADLGSHEVNDDNGEEPFSGIIKHISNQEDGLVTLLDGLKHPYQDGDYVVLSQVEGMDIIKQTIQEKSEAQIFFEQQSKQKINGINNRVFRIKVVNWNSFTIGDTRNFGVYKGNGLCRNLKVPKKLEYESLQVCSQKFEDYLDPSLGVYDFEKMGDNLSVFLCFKALSQYHRQNKALPINWTIKENHAYLAILEEIIKPLNKTEDQVKSILKFGRNFGFISQAQLPTIGAYLGGLVAQQIVKAITNKYTPIRQFFTFHINELIQKVPQNEQEIQKLRINKDEQFRNLKIVIGAEGASKIQSLKTFVIGAGAIGCQLLKNFAMVNMGSKGEIVVTDPDHIETSNLSRQFLFRDKHVKKAKSATACATLLQLNHRLEGHIYARLDKVCQETEQIYSNQFFKSRSIVANALDNVRARQYMDKRCVENKIPLFQSGTLGPKGHVQVIVPLKTENYGSQNDPNEEAQIPHCTLKMFPEETVHCIEWSRDIFGKIFTLNPKALKKVLEAKDLKIIEGQQRQTVAKMIKFRPESFEDCIAEAVRKFFVYYRNNVRQLLFTYPIDMKTKQGKLFWTLPKRPPKQIDQIDSEDESHRTFITAYAVLLAKTYSLPFPKDFRKKEEKDNIMAIARKIKVDDFVPNAQASKQIEKQVEKANNQASEQINEPQHPAEIEKPISQQVQLTEQILEIKPNAQQFQKDQDSNGHIDLIFAMSNLRCRNYGLNECTWIEAKLKAGKIMAALSTTTSIVAALQTIEIIKLATGCQTWRNAFINIAVPIIQISEPGPPIKHVIGNTTFTVWDQWYLKCSTLKDVLIQLRETYGVQGYNISLKSGKPVYWQAMYVDKEESREHLLNSKLKELFEEDVIELNIAMRKLEGGQNYENVPKVKIQIVE